MLTFEETFYWHVCNLSVRILFPISVCGVNNFQVNYMLPLLMLLIFIPGLCFWQLLLDCLIKMFEVSRSLEVLVLFLFVFERVWSIFKQ